MKKINNNPMPEPPPWMDWTREDSEALVRRYLTDYFQTLDEYFLNEAVQIAREGSSLPAILIFLRWGRVPCFPQQKISTRKIRCL